MWRFSSSELAERGLYRVSARFWVQTSSSASRTSVTFRMSLAAIFFSPLSFALRVAFSIKLHAFTLAGCCPLISCGLPGEHGVVALPVVVARSLQSRERWGDIPLHEENVVEIDLWIESESLRIALRSCCRIDLLTRRHRVRPSCWCGP